MAEIEAHRHRYRSPIAAIVGLADAALLCDDLDADLRMHLRAIHALAQQALEADDRERSKHAHTSGADHERQSDR